MAYINFGLFYVITIPNVAIATQEALAMVFNLHATLINQASRQIQRATTKLMVTLLGSRLLKMSWTR